VGTTVDIENHWVPHPLFITVGVLKPGLDLQSPHGFVGEPIGLGPRDLLIQIVVEASEPSFVLSVQVCDEEFRRFMHGGGHKSHLAVVVVIGEAADAPSARDDLLHFTRLGVQVN
jgi:hypothetical protein